MSEQPQKEPIETEFEGFGIKAKLKNWHLGNVLQLAVVAGIVAVGFVFLRSEEKAEREHSAIIEVLKAQHATQQKQLEAQEVFNYVITLDGDERKSLNLRMPESLRARIRDR
jgi:hypothetical protein